MTTVTLRRSRAATVTVTAYDNGQPIAALTRDYGDDLHAAQAAYDWLNRCLTNGWDIHELAEAVAAFDADGGAAVQPEAALAPALLPCEVAS